ncbi:HET-domain-containing protein [Cadophora sp. DSE1049]|nr:HET-domain-containing protein [Cadophora sp. DSE1049]
MSLYTDNPLLRGHAQIRLLKICPASASARSQIKCTFEAFEISKAPKYQALSYEWGPKHPVKVIDVMNSPTVIRLNLWCFLSRLQSHGYHGYLWCDAICIDQKSDYERNHQVQLMNQIYQKADCVLVWLGEADEASTSTFEALRPLAELDDFSSVCFKDRDGIWKGLLAISRRKYWTRVWIIQEITVARDIEVFCGKQKISWSILATATKFPPDKLTTWASDLWTPLADNEDERQIMRRGIGRQLHHSTMYGLMRSQRRWPRYMETITTLCTRYKESECEDRRDRIFALFKISKEVALGRDFSVDYKKDLEGIFLALMIWAGAGTIALDSRLHFANQVVESLNLRWKNYLVESKIGSKLQRSPAFIRWISQPLTLSLQCKYLGQCKFEPYDHSLVRVVANEAFLPYDAAAYMSLEELGNPSDGDYELFSFETANILLLCKSAEGPIWKVHGRASYHFRNQPRADPILVPSVFKRLRIIRETYNNTHNYSIQVQNVAQLMEILLDKLDPQVWLHPRKPTGFGYGLGPSKLVKKEDKSLKTRLSVITITRSALLTNREEKKDPDEDRGHDSIEADCEKLQAVSETLAKARVQKPPIENPREQLRSSSLLCTSKQRLFDPWCERTPAIEDDNSRVLLLDRQLPEESLMSMPKLVDLPMDFPPNFCHLCVGEV